LQFLRRSDIRNSNLPAIHRGSSVAPASRDRGCSPAGRRPAWEGRTDGESQAGHVDGRVIVELKSVDALAPIHEAQMLTYLRLTQCPVGLLINFNVQVLKDGIRRIINPLA